MLERVDARVFLIVQCSCFVFCWSGYEGAALIHTGVQGFQAYLRRRNYYFIVRRNAVFSVRSAGALGEWSVALLG